MKKTAVIIGSGVGGLAAGIRLAALGHHVTICEANPYPGGKLTVIEQDGYRWDAGPSLFTLPQLVTELFELAGVPVNDYFNYLSLPEACRYWWEDGTTFTAPTNATAFVQEAARTFGESPVTLQQRMAKSALQYETAGELFLFRPLHKPSTFLNMQAARAVAHLPSMGLHNTMAAANARSFKSPHLQQLFNRYATYNGSNPWETPAMMNVIPHLEHGLGAYLPVGGMHAITSSLVALATQMGVQLKLNCPIQQILLDGKKAVGVLCNDGPIYADLVVSNADMVATYKRLLPGHEAPGYLLKQEKSSSALIFYWGMDSTFAQLGLHNIFFSADYKAEFAHIFKQKTLYADPTVYINITSKHEPGDAPTGGENWFVMINTPHHTGQDWDGLIQSARQAIIAKLERLLGRAIEPHIATEAILDPRSIESRTGSTAGALYGNASNSIWSAFLRHPNYAPGIKNLYFCGGSVHPGGGVPLALASAKIMAGLVGESAQKIKENILP